MSDTQNTVSPIRTIDRAGLRKLWGVSDSTIDNLLQRDKLKKVGRNLFDYDQVMAFRSQQNPARISGGKDSNPTKASVVEAEELGAVATASRAARTSKLESEAEIAKLTLEKLRGSLVARAEVRRDAADVAMLLVRQLSALPSRLGPQLAETGDTAECVALLTGEIVGIVKELRERLEALG